MDRFYYPGQASTGPPPPHILPTPAAVALSKNMISIWYCSAGTVGTPEASACLPIPLNRLARACHGAYLQVKPCGLHRASLCTRKVRGVGVVRDRLDGSRHKTIRPGCRRAEAENSHCRAQPSALSHLYIIYLCNISDGKM